MRPFVARLSVLFCVAFLLSVVLPTTTRAQRSRPPAAEARDYAVIHNRYKHAILAMEKHLEVKGSEIRLKVKRGAEIGVEETLFNELAASLQQTNAKIKAGEMRREEVKLTTEFSDGQATPQSTRPLQSCAGRNGLTYQWWGPQININSCWTKNLINMLKFGNSAAQIGDAFATIAKSAKTANIMALAFIATTVWWGTLEWIHNRGGQRGVYIATTWNSVPACISTLGNGCPKWVWHQ